MKIIKSEKIEKSGHLIRNMAAGEVFESEDLYGKGPFMKLNYCSFPSACCSLSAGYIWLDPPTKARGRILDAFLVIEDE